MLLLTVKRAEDGNGLIVRVLETGGRHTGFNLTLPLLKPREAYFTNAVEETLGPAEVVGNAVRGQIGAYEIITLRILI